MDTAADSGPCDLSSIPLGEKKENKQKRGQGWPIFKKMRKRERGRDVGKRLRLALMTQESDIEDSRPYHFVIYPINNNGMSSE